MYVLNASKYPRVKKGPKLKSDPQHTPGTVYRMGHPLFDNAPLDKAGRVNTNLGKFLGMCYCQKPETNYLVMPNGQWNRVIVERDGGELIVDQFPKSQRHQRAV